MAMHDGTTEGLGEVVGYDNIVVVGYHNIVVVGYHNIVVYHNTVVVGYDNIVVVGYHNIVVYHNTVVVGYDNIVVVGYHNIVVYHNTVVVGYDNIVVVYMLSQYSCGRLSQYKSEIRNGSNSACYIKKFFVQEFTFNLQLYRLRVGESRNKITKVSEN